MSDSRGNQPVVIVERSSGGIGEFFLGLLMGAGIALLLAPSSGEETRRVLKDRARRIRAQAGEKADELREFIGEGYERTKSRVEEGFDSAREAVEETRESAAEAVKVGKDAVHSARDELEKRLSEARSERRRSRTPTEETAD